MFCEPISLATFMKKLLNVSATSVWLFIILSFSHRIMSLAKECHIISTIDVKINKIGKYTENREIW
jgi:hypothetical protein